MMSTWKKIQVNDIAQNKNDLDLKKMYKAGAVDKDGAYKALEVEAYEEFVKVLAQLEPGFEEYLLFDKEHYDTIPDYDVDEYRSDLEE